MQYVQKLLHMVLSLIFLYVPTLYSQSTNNFDQGEFESDIFSYFHKKGLACMEARNFSKAIHHFNHVINGSKEPSPDVLTAYALRANAYLQLGKRKKCFQDIKFLRENDPTCPKISREGDFIIVSNFECGNIGLKGIEELKKIYVKTGICQHKKDIQFLPEKKLLVILPQRNFHFQNEHDLVERSLKKDANKKKKKQEVKEAKAQAEKQRVIDCQRKCIVAQVAANATCAALVQKLGNSAAIVCMTTVQILAQECDDCCVEGFGECAKKVGGFVTDCLDVMLPANPSILD